MRITTLVLASALAFALVGLFLPVSLVRANGCQINWNVPSGTYSAGTTEMASVTTGCSGQGSWILTSQPSGTLVKSGSFSCPSGGCSSTPLFSKVLARGSYQISAQFNGAHFAFSFVVSDFFVVAEFPFAVLGAVVPFAAYGVFVLCRRR